MTGRAASAARFLVQMLLLCAVPTGTATPMPLVTDEEVREAIAALTASLLDAAHERRGWEPARWSDSHGSASQRGGYSALATLALVTTGTSYQSSALRPVVERLATTELTGTYAVAVRAHLWAALSPRFAPQLERDAQWLLDALSPTVGGWTYTANPATTRQDNSLRQYGALALREAARRGADIPDAVWALLEQAALATQRPDGGWNYRGDLAPSTGSMTAAGLATLFVTQQRRVDRAPRPGRPPDDSVVTAIARGLAWMDAHFDPEENPGGTGHFGYYLYGIERVGLASGRRVFAGHDWFEAGARTLIDRLLVRGEGQDEGPDSLRARTRRGPTATADRSFALLFLSRGRVPILVGKLAIDGLSWNNRPRDAANLAAWVGRTTEAQCTWQVVDLRTPAESWPRTPLLYLASHEALPDTDFAPAEIREYRDAWTTARSRWQRGETATWEKPAPLLPPAYEELRAALDAGRMLFAVTDGGGSRFARSVERLGEALYPELSWRDLPPDHAAYTFHRPLSARLRLRALTRAGRELIILAPSGDLSARFHECRPNDDRADRRRSNDDRALALVENLALVATERMPLAPRLAPGRRAAAPPRARFRLARIAHTGAFDPEPALLPALATRLAARGLAVETPCVPLARLPELAPAMHVAVLSCDSADFSPDEWRALSHIAAEGPTIIVVEGPGADAVRAELASRGAGPGMALTGSALLRAPNDLSNLTTNPGRQPAETPTGLVALPDATTPHLIFAGGGLTAAAFPPGAPPEALVALFENLLTASSVDPPAADAGGGPSS